MKRLTTKFTRWNCANKHPLFFDLYEIADRLAAIEDILGDDYDLDRLSVIVNQCMSMREEVSERFRLTQNIPLERLQELAQADKGGKIKAYIVEGFYCGICRERHERITEIEVYLTHAGAEAALKNQ